ncbi:MAG: TolC family protein [Acidobacteriota bacterium]|nr:MAG: TolC family protein [Acidobacteriota bacterium]
MRTNRLRSHQYWILYGILTVAVLSGLAQSEPGNSPEFYTGHPQLEEYVRTALTENPELHASFSRYRASLQRIPQVKALPDPTLTFTQFLRSPETRVGPQSNITMISQRFPWFGKLDLKAQIALRESSAMFQMYEAQERQVIAEVKRAFYELGYVDQTLDILREEELLLSHYETLAQARYSQGSGMQQGVIKIQAEITQVINRVNLLNQQRETMVARLNTLMDRPPEQAIPSVRGIDLPEVRLDLDVLYELGEKNRQELKASLARIEKSERSVELAKKDYWPDLTVGASLINVEDREDLAGILMPPPDNGKNAFSFTVGVNIPIWRDKYRAGVIQATEEGIAERRGYSRILNEMEFSIRDQVVRMQTLVEQIELYDRVLLVQAEEALRSTEAGYETGQLSILELLDSERFLLRTRLLRERYRTDYMRALADLERAVGTKFPVS